jgi:SagB-type dehydrogenase family enzyme
MKNKNNSHFPIVSLSRRSALKAAALAGGALTLAGCGNGAPAHSGDSPAAVTPFSAETVSAADTPPPAYLPEFASGAMISLPRPRTGGGMPLMDALMLRKSRRSYDKREIPVQTLSDLLWAAFGINRPAQGLRTAPSAINTQDIELYIAVVKGVHRYDAKGHALQAVMPDDLRALTGSQSFAAQAPLELVYVSDYGKLQDLSSGEYGGMTLAWSWIHTGFISQNVYLFCASEGLSTVVRGMVDRFELEDKIGLDSMRHISMVQSVGYAG